MTVVAGNPGKVTEKSSMQAYIEFPIGKKAGYPDGPYQAS
jgi:hypothetical protein